MPVITSLLKKDFEVVIAGNGNSLEILKMEFPQLEFEYLPGVEITYGKSRMSVSGILWQVPGFIYNAYREHSALKKLISRRKIGIVISDNRYGLWSKKCHSVFICHQLNVKLPRIVSFVEKPLNFILKRIILKFNKRWVPDTADHALAAELSQAGNLPVKYIGPLSRFYDSAPAADETYEVLVVLSGPEPQRSVLEEKLSHHLSTLSIRTLFVRGITKEYSMWTNGAITFVNSLSTPALHFHLQKSKYIICRSGYSSLMDLAALKRSAVIIPTPGQEEQEYLAREHHMKNHYCMQQEDIDLSVAFSSLTDLQYVDCKPLIDEAVEELPTGAVTLPVNA